MKPSLFADALIATATNFVGLSEVKSNAVWDDLRTKEIEADKSAVLSSTMKELKGWTPGAAYCAAFSGAMILITMRNLGFSKEAEIFKPKWTAHVMTNVRAMQERPKEFLVSEPLRGSIWLARHGRTDTGHAGIVVSFNAGKYIMNTIEGNTSAGGTADPELQRNGDGIYSRLRAFRKNGSLSTQGFVPVEAIMRMGGVPRD